MGKGKTKIKIISIVGARPNFIKIAPFCEVIKGHAKSFDHMLIHTGQHYDKNMSDDIFAGLKIPDPDVNLGIGSAPHAVQTGHIMIKVEEMCLKHRPDWVVVVGDVNSTMAGALVASKLGIKVAHIEAGLRSFDRTMPEEINRIVTDQLSDLLFTPSLDANQNLRREGIDPDRICLVGNIMIDTIVANLKEIKSRRTYERFGLSKNGFIYVTLHRPSNVDHKEALRKIVDHLLILAKKLPIIFPGHPRTKRQLKEFNLRKTMKESSNLHLIDPVSYHDSISFAMNARLVITDSGGVQEETTYLGTPCLTLRPNTERPVTITEGTNRLTTKEDLLEDAEELIKMPKEEFDSRIPYLWDGKTAQRIVDKFCVIHNR
ncbi:MAG: non-hydrolyzing UDP-N-acetylglucosamine 2-epimerase [Thermodesulfobacteriota bacterium]